MIKIDFSQCPETMANEIIDDLKEDKECTEEYLSDMITTMFGSLKSLDNRQYVLDTCISIQNQLNNDSRQKSEHSS